MIPLHPPAIEVPAPLAQSLRRYEHGDVIDAMSMAYALALRDGADERTAMAYAIAALRDGDLPQGLLVAEKAARISAKDERRLRRCLGLILAAARGTRGMRPSDEVATLEPFGALQTP